MDERSESGVQCESFERSLAKMTQSRGVYAEALAEYRQAALRATEDIEDALMELAQTQVRLQELQGEVASLTRARPFGASLQGRRNSAD